jgi:long-chain acyl-CoA synthetase
MALDYTSNPTDLPEGTLCELFLGAVDAFRDDVGFRFFPGEGPEIQDVTYGDLFKRVRAAEGGLREMGLERGDKAAIISENRVEWAVSDYACLCSGVLDVPIYPTLTAEQVAYIIGNSGARVVFASEELVTKVLDAATGVEQDVTVVVFGPTASCPEGTVPWSDFLESGRRRAGEETEEDFRARALEARPEDVATILYTSGTTGSPKGVQLTHNNLFSNVEASSRVLALKKVDSTMSFLPLSHVFQRMVDYLHLSQGVSIAYAHSVQTVADDLKLVRPSIVCSVPRLYEKVYDKVTAAEGLKRKLVQWASGVGDEWAEVKLAGVGPGAWLGLRYSIADALVFKKIRAAVGGNLRFFVSGSAPLSPKLNRFFYSIGLTILEGYGLTETSPVTNVNTFESFRIGTVGKAVPGTEIKIAEDGEILVRGPQVMKGYYNLPEATAAAIDSEGWFSTGDIGEIDDDGYLKITDRKKDLIKTSGGKYVAPQPIENELKASAFIDQVVVIGDRRKFCAVIIVPAFPALEKWARAIGLNVVDPAALLERREVQELFESEVSSNLGGLAHYEMPKKIGLIADAFTIEDGSLTPTQKVKRRVVEERYSDLIDAFYEPANVDRAVFVRT